MNYPVRTKDTADHAGFDVQLDWLYKGKRRNKPKGLNSLPIKKKAPTISATPVPKTRNRSKSISNGMLSESKTTSNEWNEVKQDVLKKNNHLFPEKSSNTPTSTRSRSSTMTDDDHNSMKRISNVNSTTSNDNNGNSGLHRSNSMNEKPKRSIFSSLFGKKLQDTPTLTIQTSNPTTIVTPTKINNKQQEIIDENVSELSKLAKNRLRRVRFAVDKIEDDPPQQLPSRKPKMGNILIPEEMISSTPLISVGISNSKNNSSSNDTQISSPPSSLQGRKFTRDSKEYKIVLEHYKKSLKESERRQLESHEAAECVAKEVRNYKIGTPLKKIKSNESRTSGKSDEDFERETTIDSTLMSNIEIDKPLHINAHPFQNSHSNEISEPGSPNSNKEMTLDVIYTRCCHLREILPIPSTLRQVKGKTAPLHVIKFLNPRPTLIDILSFCDFISIVPIHIVIFDNVLLSSEMFRILLTSLVNSKVLEKLGLRNVVINQSDWRFFCSFMLQNRSLIKLDISQTKTRSEQDLSTYRENMNWSLLAEVLNARKGRPLEELLLNGIKVSYIPLDELMTLLNIFGKKNRGKSRQRLGMAMTDIDEDHIRNIFNWMSQFSIQGVDFAFNNLTPLVKPIIDKLSLLNYEHLEYFTLNSTFLTDVDEVTQLLNCLANLPNLQFLDLSNLPALFPAIFPSLNETLPKFKQLKRIHLDNNNMDDKQLTLLCNILVKCKTLSHISLMTVIPTPSPVEKIPTGPDEVMESKFGMTPMTPINVEEPKQENEKSSEFVKSSLWGQYYSLAHDMPNLLSLDINYDEIPDELQSRIALCLMRNMKKTMDSTFQIDELTSQDELLFDGSLLTDTADQVLKRLEETSVDGTVDTGDLDASRKYMLKKYIEKLDNVLKKVQITIDLMLEKSKNDQLPEKEKENLLSLLLLKRNLSNILEILLDVPRQTAGVMSPVSQAVSSFDARDITTPTTPVRPDLRHMDSARLLSQAVGTVMGRATEHSKEREETEFEASRPHVMATDSGRVIDVQTGQQVLHKSSSNTSLASKLQEQEEGEFHKWGYFRQHSSMLNDDLSSPIITTPNNEEENSSMGTMTPRPGQETNPFTDPKLRDTKPKILPKIPTGSELRKAIMKAKGIESIDDLIKKVSDNKSELETIYNAALNLSQTSSINDSVRDSAVSSSP
ncbi:similar to Saccharomyces cerevisiae YPL137C GIP3 Glc7-interacting protein whose overexpression relocalizes Glc7p from the nucleus and prevents chromosome segregation [Maudiozyma saulgeensis]|uniref:Similar to Saccharomyces cerevisiae YPL137C GIP3 Glc7-interacting protein whose overexpression relocalizes Glc7p from the nucleus and prevents chromosome segregation n=1 Tax=Maudiozyma saulgeensis TaxID=1789683 RepID=A0A1X7R3K4_9SACH|nr:similar to Saccharomyces cerevisiae YPL137C GIP3 Glc7-interacting protein whose overexpression relocalizes Glc7p from the nucleus and prevents chromosome segregation [Kazachstania saulgeensis]